MPVAEELIALLGFRVKGQGELAKWKKGLTDGEQQAKGVAGRLRGLGAVAGTAGLALGAMAVKGVQNFAAFERQMTRIGVTAGASVEQTEAAARTIQDLANKFALPLDEARQGLDTLVSSGMSLEQAMGFLPSVLATAQAAGAATNDIANTAQKTASALGIQSDRMQKAFDIMVTGGKAGQFELRDMASFIPSLASEFATLGYKGEDGLKRLIAMLQTLRTQTGTAGEAATQASNIFGKMYSEQTAKNFKDFGINLRKEMEAAKKAGTDALTAFVQLSEKALKGDMTKLPLLFQDAELRKGMTTLISAKDAWKGFIDEVNSSKVEGSTMQDLKRVLDDTESSIQKMGNSWDQMLKTIGGAVADPASKVMDAVTAGIDKTKAADEARQRRGDSLMWRAFAPYVESPDEALKSEREARKRSGTDFLTRPVPAPASTPAILQSRPGALGGAQTEAAKQSLGDLNGRTATSTAVLDVAQFLFPAMEAKNAMAELQNGVTAKADLDISPILAKVEQAKAAYQSLKNMTSGASGSWGAPATPARVVGAGAAP